MCIVAVACQGSCPASLPPGTPVLRTSLLLESSLGRLWRVLFPEAPSVCVCGLLGATADAGTPHPVRPAGGLTALVSLFLSFLCICHFLFLMLGSRSTDCWAECGANASPFWRCTKWRPQRRTTGRLPGCAANTAAEQGERWGSAGGCGPSPVPPLQATQWRERCVTHLPCSDLVMTRNQNAPADDSQHVTKLCAPCVI